jgi:hypothetical protein
MPVPHEIVEAAYKGNLKKLQAWLDGGGTAFLEEEVDYADLTGEEPLSDESDEDDEEYRGPLLKVACDSAHENVPIVEALLEAGANACQENLMNAIGQGKLGVVRLLLEHDHIDVKERFGVWTALHYAAAGGRNGNDETMWSQPKIVEALLAAGARVDAGTERNDSWAAGETPLMCAARQRCTRLDTLKQLLAYGANMDLQDENGRSAFDRAVLLPDVPDYLTAYPYSPRTHPNLVFLRAVRSAGSFKKYVNVPRRELLVLRKLAERGRARAARGVLARLFPSGRQLRKEGCLPDVLFWNVLSFWHSSRDCGAPPPLWCV